MEKNSMTQATKTKLEKALTTLLREQQDSDTVTEVVQRLTKLNVRLMNGKLQLFNANFRLMAEADICVKLLTTAPTTKE